MRSKSFSFFAQIIQIIVSMINDLLFFSGIAIVIWTNFRVHNFFGWYSLGVTLIVTGLGLTRLTYKRPQK